MRLDSHQHFWNYQLPRHEWIDEEMAAIRRDFTPADLKPILDKSGIDGCISVEANQDPTETAFLLDIAAKNDWVKGVVGWVDLRAADIEEKIAAYAGREKLKGFRHVVQAEPDPYFLLQKNFLRGIAAVGKAGYTYDILIFPHQLVSALELVKQFPNQKFVIDHIAKPYIKDGYFTGWAAAMSAFEDFDNVWCKVSGMVTEADYENWTEDQLRPYIDHALEVFGTDKIMFGSDWPVLRVAADYAAVADTFERAIAGYSESEQAGMMGGNCAEFYGVL